MIRLILIALSLLWTQFLFGPPTEYAIKTAVAAALTMLVVACAPNPPADDSGHATFAVESIPILLGRRPHGVDEVEVVADIAELLGRDVAVQMMMKDNDFIDHWTHVIMDLLEVQRHPTGGISVAQDSDCWGVPTRANPDPAIAEWVRDHGPKAAGAIPGASDHHASGSPVDFDRYQTVVD